MSSTGLIRAAAVLGFLGVAAGAFGAHALRGSLSPELREIFETAVRYHLVHALALLGAGLLAGRVPGRAPRTAGLLFLVGVVVFSGSLYLLALTGARWLGAVTPIGGVAFLGGWIALFLSARTS